MLLILPKIFSVRYLFVSILTKEPIRFIVVILIELYHLLF
nr:MAG TPA: hypothetical protein [Caudoviricetes sp.]